jgi:crotonobetainyl-CoA:carnitine CoA-transferase CaiB-like acyl-CoA transferase
MRGANLPLEGVTVVSLEQAVAAPFATRQLADLGARVIKVERPGVGDFARGYDETVMGMSSHFVWLNRSKESLGLDLRQRTRPKRSCVASWLGPTSSSRTSPRVRPHDSASAQKS